MPPTNNSATAKPRNSHLRLPDSRGIVVDHPASIESVLPTDLPEVLFAHELFSRALDRYMKDRFSRKQESTRKNAIKAFRLLWRFLDYEQGTMGRAYRDWDDVDDGFLGRLIGWMSNADVTSRLGVVTKAQRYNLIRSFFEWLKLDRGQLPEGWVVRKNPWPLSYRLIKPRDVLSEAELGPIIRAAVRDVEQTVAKWTRTRALIDDPLIAVPPPAAKMSAYKSEDVALKTLAAAFPGALPRRVDLKACRQGLYDAFRIYPHLSYVRAIEALLPTPRLLVPFVILIAQATLFNPETLLQLRWSDIDEEHPVYGPDRWRLRGEKRRAGGKQYRSFPAKVKHLTNPVELLKILRKQTSSLRSGLPSNLGKV